MTEIVFVGAGSNGIGGNGKMSPERFLDAFKREAGVQGAKVEVYWKAADYISRARSHRGAAVVMIYNEQRVQHLAEALRVMDVERVAREHECQVIHPLNIGLMIGRKRETSLALAAHGVPVPRVIAAESHHSPVFSNHPASSGATVALYAPKTMLPTASHNTEFINAEHDFAGRKFTVCLRALCVGGHVCSLYVRAAPAPKLSIHAADSVSDADVINGLHNSLIRGRMAELSDICRRIGQVFGPGFYAHDIVPAARGLYVCESGFKFDDGTYRTRFEPMRMAMPCPELWNGEVERTAARAFIEQIRQSSPPL